MSEVIGSCRTLPGARHELPDGTMCDDHPDRPAVARVQGETDSFGAELNDLCAECLAEFKTEPDPSGECDWCKAQAPKLVTTRDYDEGLAGRVYYVCVPCKDSYQKALEDEYDRYHGFG